MSRGAKMEENNNTKQPDVHEEINSSTEAAIQQPDLKNPKDLNKEDLIEGINSEVDQELTVDALISLYYSVGEKFKWLSSEFGRTGVERRHAGILYRKLLQDSNLALKKEILSMLELYGIRVFCDTSLFDGRRHRAEVTKLTSRRELSGYIARVERDGFVQQRPEGLVIFHPEIVVVYKYKDSRWCALRNKILRKGNI